MTQKRQNRQAGKGPMKKNPLWHSQREGARPLVLAVIAIVGVAAILGGYLLQSSALLLGNKAASASESASIRISEVMAENASALITDTGDVPDWIEIENAGSSAVNVGKYAMLLESNVNKIYTFPNRVLAPGEYLVVTADGVTSGKANGELSAPFRIPASGGDTLVLLNAQGKSIDAVELPELGVDQSYCRDEDGAWQVSATATPGRKNSLTDASGEVKAAVNVHAGALEISEVMTSNTLYFADENGQFHDYVEIHNTSASAVNLKGWYLSDSSDKLHRWSFPDVEIPAGGYLAVHCSGEDRISDPNHLHTNFKLSRDGESVYLSMPDGQTVSAVDVPALSSSQAYSYFEGSWTTALGPTPSGENSHSSAAQFNAYYFGNRSGVYINEIMASPSSQNYDWIEIYNGSGQAVDLGGYGLSDDVSKPRKWQFPSGTVIQPGQYMGVYLSGTEAGTLDCLLNASFALAAEGGYTVSLSTADGSVFDAIYLPRQYGGVSYGRSDGESGCFFFAEGTPGTANTTARYRGRADIAEYSVRGGLYRTGQSFTVELSAPEGSRIYYTLDCTDPTESSTYYTGPITVSGTTILRTRVYRDGYMESYMDTQSYLFDVGNEGMHRVVSLVSDPDNLTSQDRGIMIKGPNATDTFPYGSMNKGANFWMDWEREAHVELYMPSGEQAISQECGIKLHGQYSRAADVKAFKVIARNEYGKNRFEYPIFTDRDYEEYQSFVLRASGQDYNLTFMRDSVLTTLAEDTSVMYQESEVCVVYLNGVYYSMMYIRERITKHSICQFEGWEGMEDDIDLIKANDRVMQGSNATFETMLEWIKDNKDKCNTDEFYDYIASVIDIQNYKEYMAIEIFVGNGDTLNVKRYRNAKDDGKWRWVLFDLDWAFFTDTNSINRWLDPEGMGTGKYTDTTLFIGLMLNDRFRDEFLTYFGEQLATTFSTRSVMAKIEARYDLIDGLLPEYLQKLGMSQEKYNKQLKKFVDYAETRPTKILGYFDGVFNFSEAEMEKYFGAAIKEIQAWSNGG
ncbi:MAG: lamin tail domain-containing protein [Clostridia bacterium]|nr:lamin tail domain-containing protein [Clostridia bacterium]